MNPSTLAHRLSLLGVAGYAFFLFLRPNPEGMALALGLALGGASIAYGEKPFPVPLFLGLFALILLLHLLQGHPLPFLLGGGLGLGLPYLVYLCLRPRR